MPGSGGLQTLRVDNTSKIIHVNSRIYEERSKMLSREEICIAMRDRNLSEVARNSLMDYQKLRRLVNDWRYDPPYSVIKAASNYLIAMGTIECPHCNDGEGE